VSRNSSTELTDVSFEKNEATSGGAVRLSESSNTTITNCDFTNNTASDGGGAILLCGNCSLSVNSSTLSGNITATGYEFSKLHII